MDYPPPARSQFIIECKEGADKKMIDFAKMTILLAFEEYPNDDLEKCKLIASKFEEIYHNSWGVSIIEKGDSLFYYDKYYMKIKYKQFTIKIMRTKKK